MERPAGSLIGYFSNRVKKEGGINLAQGIPGFPPPQPLLNLLAEIATDVSQQQYPPGNGNFQLLELIQTQLSPFCPVNSDQLLILQGATEGIFLTFFYLTTQLVPPYSVLSFDPVYESYPKLAAMFKIPFESIPLSPNLEVDFDYLERVIIEKKVKVVFIASPGNPLGKVWTQKEIVQIVQLAEKHRFYIIFDAVYKDLCFFGAPFNPLSLAYEDLFYVDSFSKMLSITGWRIGYAVAHPMHMKRIRAIHDYTGLCASSVLQAVIARYLHSYDYGKQYVASLNARCRASFLLMNEKMTQLGFRVAPIGGGYFIWAKLPNNWHDAFEFAQSLYEKVKLAVVPGENFSSISPDYIRVNIAVELPVLAEAAQRLTDFLNPINL